MIGRVASLLGTLALAAPLALAQTSTWVPDKAHSGVDFSILHMSLSQVRGHFGNISGSIVWNEGDITKSTVNVTIDVTTVDTGVAARDADLKSDHFFDVAKFPSATFVSTSVSKSGRPDDLRQPDSAWGYQAGGAAGRRTQGSTPGNG